MGNIYQKVSKYHTLQSLSKEIQLNFFIVNIFYNNFYASKISLDMWK